MKTNRLFNSIEEMDETMIDSWNKVVFKESTVFHIGDLSWYNAKKTLEILKRLNGKKYLVMGNHDWQCESGECKREFQLIADRIELELDDDQTDMVSRNPEKKTQLIVLDHYPKMSWNKAYHGSFHLFGHVHNRIKEPIGRSMDVGVDAIGIEPISYTSVREKLLKIRIHERDDE